MLDHKEPKNEELTPLWIDGKNTWEANAFLTCLMSLGQGLSDFTLLKFEWISPTFKTNIFSLFFGLFAWLPSVIHCSKVVKQASLLR